MSYSINITDLAEDDILAIATYISKVLKNPIAANNLLDEIERHEKILEDMPTMYPFVNDKYLSGKGLKYVAIKNFLMFYTIDEHNKIVTIIRFLYKRRDWKNLFSELAI